MKVDQLAWDEWKNVLLSSEIGTRPIMESRGDQMKILLSMLVLVAFSGFAKTTGKYKFSFRNDNNGKGYSKIGNFDCTTTVNHDFDSYYIDQAGKRKSKNVHSAERESSIFKTKKVFETEVSKDMQMSSPIKTRVIEHCSYGYWQDEDVTRCDPNGQNCKQVSESVHTTDSLTVEWDCPPMNESNEVKCNLNNKRSNYDDNSDAWKDHGVDDLFEEVKKKNVFVSSKLVSRQDSVTFDLCHGKNLQHRKIIKLSRGITPGAGENDFVISMNLLGYNKPLVFKKTNGIFEEEIAVCTPGNISFSMNMIEDDLFFDDVYECEGNKNVTLSTKIPAQSKSSLKFKRKGWFGDSHHTINMEIRDAAK